MKKNAAQRTRRAIRICALPFALLVAVSASAASISWTQSNEEVWNTDINCTPSPSTEKAAVYTVIVPTKPNSKNTVFTVSALEIPTYPGLITIRGTNSLTLNNAGMNRGYETQDFAAKAILACSENQANPATDIVQLSTLGSKVNLNRIAANDTLSQVAIITFDTEAKKNTGTTLTGRLSGATNTELTLAPIFSRSPGPLRSEDSAFGGENSVRGLPSHSSSNAGNSPRKTARNSDVASFLSVNGEKFAGNNFAILGQNRSPEVGSTSQADGSPSAGSESINSLPNSISTGEAATADNSRGIASLIAQNDLFKVAQTKAGVNSELTNLGLPKQNSNNSSNLSAPMSNSLGAYNQGLTPTQISPNISAIIFSSATIAAQHSTSTASTFSSTATSGDNFSGSTSSIGENATRITIAANGTTIETKLTSSRTLAVKRAPSLAATPLVVETDVKFNSDGAFLLDNLSNPLSAGGTGNGDGFAVQLGYYDAASISNNFAGNWVPMTGQNSLNTAFSTTSIGDGLGDPGELYATYIFRSSLPNTYMSLPPNTTIPLSLRFYNAVLISNATLYNAVSNDLWLWKTPGETSPIPPTIEMSLTQSNLEWEGGAPSAFKTALAAPEPSTAVLLAAGVLGLIGRRRRL
jgi:hypothetical protein